MSREAIEWLWKLIQLHPKTQHILYIAVKYNMTEEDMLSLTWLYSTRNLASRSK